LILHPAYQRDKKKRHSEKYFKAISSLKCFLSLKDNLTNNANISQKKTKSATLIIVNAFRQVNPIADNNTAEGHQKGIDKNG